MMKLNRCFLLLILFITASCTDRNISYLLTDVESYINDHPDSALSVIETIDANAIKSKELRARHALLHVMSQDKCFIDVADDSLGKVATEYYTRFKSDGYTAKSLYYLGKSYFYAGKYEKAILELTKAEKEAIGRDSLYLGMIRIAQAMVHSVTYNDVESLNCIKNAYEIYTAINADKYIPVAKLRLAQAYANLAEYEKSKLLYKELLNESKGDIYYMSLINAAMLHMTCPEMNAGKAEEMFREAFEAGYGHMFHNNNYWAWANSLIITGKNTDAEKIIAGLEGSQSDATTSYWLYMTANTLGNKDEALTYLENYVRRNETEVAQVLKQSIAITQRDYYESLHNADIYKLRNRNLTILAIITLSLLIITIVIFVLTGFIKRQRIEKMKYISYAEEISRQLRDYKAENPESLKKKFIELYHTKFEVLGQLCDQYMRVQDRNDKETLVYRKVVSLVDELKSDRKARMKFEEILNRDLNNIMRNLKEEFPNFKEIDYAIFSYVIVGFDAMTIASLLGESINNIYSRKSRIKHKIYESNAPHKNQFLEVMQ